MHALVLVTLTEQQILLATEKNGSRKTFTHALICGSYGQIFGTESHCRKYYKIWKDIFKNLFDEAIETNAFLITDYVSSFNLVNTLIEQNELIKKNNTANISV
jgi:hypothetical protein